MMTLPAKLSILLERSLTVDAPSTADCPKCGKIRGTSNVDNRLRVLLATFLLLVSWQIDISTAWADNLTLVVNGSEVELQGEILIEAVDNSLYFRENDGKIWFVKPDQVKAKSKDEATVKPIGKKKLAERLLTELPPGFRVYETKHYLIAYQNELIYARWIGGLYESRLYRAFEAFWEKKKKIRLKDPQYPLVAIIFGSKVAYDQHVQRELGAGQSMVAYYNLQTNRITMYDLTAGFRNPNQELNDRRIEQILQTPSVIPMVATIIHEGTHQLIFNRGMQTRFAESPLWMNEGLAMYFETPDRQSARGWKAPGRISDNRLATFRRYLPRRQENALERMIRSDVAFRDPQTRVDAYAEAWAFNHFLLNKRSREYTDYLRNIATKKALIEETPEQRLTDFKRFLGEDLEQLDQDFIDHVMKLR
jgi:hypothetical protein